MSRAPRALDHGAGKEALLRATVRVVATKGLRGLTFRAVAEEAGVNNTLIAHHFKSRDNLIAATLEWTLDRSLGAADLSQWATDPAAFRDALVANVASHPDIELFQFEMILESSRRHELQPLVRRLYGRYVAELAAGRALLDTPTSDALSLALFAALDGLMLQYFSRAISAAQLAEAVESLGQAVGSEKDVVTGIR